MSDDLAKLEDIKIVICGLDNAGKTSALIALRKKYNFYEEIRNLKPTIKIEYSSFNFLNRYLINFWDAGGQAKYRKIYINNPIYFTETNYLYFLIDIQDELKFEESIKYLHDILDIYRNLDYSNEFLICFNKYDPKFRNNEEFTERVHMIKDLILIQNKELKFKFFETSIYDISTLSKAMSYSLSKLLNLENINLHLKNLVNEFNCNHAVLYTNEGMIISDYYNEKMDPRDFEEIISNRINEDLEFFQRLTDNQVVIDERLSFINDHIEYVKKFDINSSNGKLIFYLGLSVSFKNIKEIKSNLEMFHTQLETTFY
jgi:small GTP-binding protein